MSEKNGMQILEIHEVTQDDLGTYTCVAVNGSGKASMSAELSIPGLDSATRSFVRGTKAPSSDTRKEVTNGISKDPETVPESKNCSSPQRSVSSAWATNSHLKSPQEPKLKLCEESPRKALQSSVLQKTSSTITLQAAKVQPEARVPGLGAFSPGAAPQQAMLPTRQCGLGGPIGNKFVTRNIPVES
ncbi:Myosin light chain kinase, smooth muscle, partial [Lemmus lemmus]